MMRFDCTVFEFGFGVVWMGILETLKQKVHPECIGLAIFVHELSGISWMIGAWSAMYIVNPTNSLMKRFDGLNEYQQKANAWTNRKMERMPRFIKHSQRLNVPRLVTSGVESYLLRNLLRPVTIPAKIAFAVYAAKKYADHKYGDTWSATTQSE